MQMMSKYIFVHGNNRCNITFHFELTFFCNFAILLTYLLIRVWVAEIRPDEKIKGHSQKLMTFFGYFFHKSQIFPPCLDFLSVALATTFFSINKFLTDLPQAIPRKIFMDRNMNYETRSKRDAFRSIFYVWS